ncbi:MAG TPA: fumarylacetoacetate hydrolase family protein [Burkholderiaceae bacterium]
MSPPGRAKGEYRSAPGFALARLSVAGCPPFAAVVSGDRALPISALRGVHRLRGGASIHALLAHWSHDEPVLADADLNTEAGAPLSNFTVVAPLTPTTVYCTIGNYRSQVLEAARDADPATDAEAFRQALERRRRDGDPYIALKPACAVAGPFTPLAIDPSLKTLDWEVEIGAVIGKPARNVSVDAALQHVAGYCTVNDITLRERLFRTEPKAMGTDFLQAKGGPGWLPLGPWLVPARHVPDVSVLRLTLKLNGRAMQEGVASDMLFGIAEQIAYLSRHVQLQPGDLVCTGSPAGFGIHHGRFLRPGDVVEAEVESLGVQRTLVTAEP